MAQQQPKFRAASEAERAARSSVRALRLLAGLLLGFILFALFLLATGAEEVLRVS